MVRHTRSSSSNQNRYSNPLPVSLTPVPNPAPDMYDQRMPMPEYYPVPSSSDPMHSQQQPSYDAYSAVPVPTVPHRASSGAWTPADDQTLISARAQGLNWSQIQTNYFHNKTPNACRKRHERLMERKGANEWDNRKLERLAQEYMGMRKDIWSGLAARTGEKWNVVEAKCMSNGLKNLQSACRAAARRERLESSQQLQPGYDDGDDSGIDGIGLTPVDELDPSYSSPETASSGHSLNGGRGSHHPAAAGYATHHHFNMQPIQTGQYYAPAGGHHGYTSSVSSTASGAGYANAGHQGHSQSTSPYLHPGQRMPSADMGIDAIINRPGGAPPPM